MLSAIYDNHSDLIGYFVKGTPAIATSNQYSDVDLSAVNETKCILEKLFWKDESMLKLE